MDIIDPLTLTKEQQAMEFFKCRRNPFYFIYNYIKIPEIGGELKYKPELMHSKLKQTVRSAIIQHRVILMASRQLGKSTIIACIIEWACNFFPRNSANILNANKEYSLANLQMIKYIHEQLPNFLRTPLKYKGERKTFIEYKNDSIIRAFYPGTSTDPATIARSLTSPILYIDEAAHIRHIAAAFGAAQPTLSRARQQAEKNKYPYFIAITSTPNSSFSVGKWFYDMYQFAIDAENIFDEKDLFVSEANEVVNNPERNGFIQIKYHWSEDPTKDENGMLINVEN